MHPTPIHQSPTPIPMSTPPPTSRLNPLARTGKRHRQPWLTSCALALCFAVPAPVRADYLRGEQTYGPDLVEGMYAWQPLAYFWDAAFWRNRSLPAAARRMPGDGDWLDFGAKDWLGRTDSFALRNLTLYTSPTAEFPGPVVTPTLDSIYFPGSDVRVLGDAANPGVIHVADYVYVTYNAAPANGPANVNFEQTALTCANLLMNSSQLKFSGDMSDLGLTNFRSTGTTTLQRWGASPDPQFTAQQNAVAQLAALHCEFTLYADHPNTGSGPTLKTVTGGQISTAAVVLTHPSGVICSATGSGAIQLGSLESNGMLPDTDPVLLFQGVGLSLSPAPVLGVTGLTKLTSFAGTLANVTNAASATFHDVELYGLDNALTITATDNASVVTGAVLMSSARSLPGEPAAATNLNLYASTGGSIAFGALYTAGSGSADGLRLSGTSTLHAASGGSITLQESSEVRSGGSVSIVAEGAGSMIHLPFTPGLAYTVFSGVSAWPAAPLSWDQFTLSITDGACLKGAELPDTSGYWTLESSTLTADNFTNASSAVTIANASVQQISFDFYKPIGMSATGATLQHVGVSLDDDSSLVVSGGTWQAANALTAGISQAAKAGRAGGNSSILLGTAAVAHGINFEIGCGTYSALPSPVPAALSTLTIEGGSTVTGMLDAATMETGNANVLIQGAGTTAGFGEVKLGVRVFPAGASAGYWSLWGVNNFDFSPCGTANLRVVNGARLAVGSHAGAWGTWSNPLMSWRPAFLAMHESAITIDATSAVYLGEAADAATLAGLYQPGKLVVGPGGFLLGNGTVTDGAGSAAEVVVAGGEVRPGYSPGHLAVNGTFSMVSGALILEIKGGSAGGFDVITANHIALSGGTILIKPTADFAAGGGFSVNLFNSADLSIGSGVAVQIDPALGLATFNPLTGVLQVTVNSSGDANGDGINDLLASVLPMSETHPGVLDAPEAIMMNGERLLSFKRLDASETSVTLAVQWSSDLVNWTSIPVGATSTKMPKGGTPPVTVTENGALPDTIQVILPRNGDAPVFARLQVAPLQ